MHKKVLTGLATGGVLLGMAGGAKAAEVPWNATHYNESTQVYESRFDNGVQRSVYFVKDDKFGDAPLAAANGYEKATGAIGSSTSDQSPTAMRVTAISMANEAGQEMYSGASASFSGEFTATGQDLNFSYSINAPLPQYGVRATFSVYDRMAKQSLYDASLNTGKNSVVVGAPAGHTLEVVVYLDSSANSFFQVTPACDTCVTPEGIISADISLNYTVTLVDNP